MGWTNNIFTQIVVVTNSSETGIFIYSGPPGFGNLIGAWTSAPGTDQYGNPVPGGLYATSGTLTGIGITNAELIDSLFTNGIIQNTAIGSPSITGGTMTETTITFDGGGGQLLVYSSSTTTVNQTANGQYQITVPANVSNFDVSCQGASAGGSGGSSSRGGEGGGAGEFARETHYSVLAGSVLNYQVGNGGGGGQTGQSGSPGTDTWFDNSGGGYGVYANGGDNGSGFVGGLGGTGSTNTIHYNGGNGGSSNSGDTGGAGGGGSAGTLGAGGNGAQNTGSGGAAGGSAGAGLASHAGGAGGSNGNNGAAGTGSGAGGGGAGAGSSTNAFSKTYACYRVWSYYGSDTSGNNNPNGIRSSGQNMSPFYQGGESSAGGTFNGTQKAIISFGASIQSDLSGVSISKVTLRLHVQHSWYNSGLTCILGYTSYADTGHPNTWNGSTNRTALTNYDIGEGSTVTRDLTGTGLGSALQSGAAKTLCVGPGSSYDLNNYGYFTGPGGSSSQEPSLYIEGTTGTGVNVGGNGQDGQVIINYQTATILVAAISPVAGTDANGNAFGVGYTGQTNAFTPGSNPTVVETWNSITPGNSWTGTLQYKYMSDNSVWLVGSMVTPAAGVNGTIVTLPAGYRPATATTFDGTHALAASFDERWTLQTNGNLSASGFGVSQAVYINERVSLDSAGA